MRTPSMRDIASVVGVSAVTVSKALAGKSGVSEAVRRRIMDTAEKMGYVNPRDAQPADNEPLDVGILVPDRYFGPDSYYAAFYKQLVQTLTEAGHFGMLELLPDEMEKNGVLPNLIRSGHADAVILLGQPTKDYLRMIASQKTPVVFLDFYDEQASADAVVGDNTYGTYRLTSHLIKQGHSDIGFIGSYRATSSIMDRYLGFCRAMLLHDLPIRPECIIPDRDEQGRIIPILLPDKLPTALVCNCDLTAVKTIAQLESLGLKVPQDVSVVGFDDFCIGASSTLSTFQLDMPAMARMAVSLAAQRCSGIQSPFGRIVVGGQPIYRASDGPAPCTAE